MRNGFSRACRCCSHCRKYVLVIGHGEDNSYGIIMNKTGPDAFIRSKKQLISLPSEYWSVQTRHRSIYLLTRTPFNSQDTRYGVSLDINQRVAVQLTVYESMPESKWDFSKRRWHFQNDDEWGIVRLDFVNQRQCSFFVLLLSYWSDVFILDSDMYEKDIALLSQSSSTLTRYDVSIFLGLENNPEFKSEKDFPVNEPAIRVKARLVRGEGKQSLAVWTEGNISRSHVQLVLY